MSTMLYNPVSKKWDIPWSGASPMLDDQGNWVVPIQPITYTYSGGILSTMSWGDGTYTWTVTYGNDGTNITSESKPVRT